MKKAIGRALNQPLLVLAALLALIPGPPALAAPDAATRYVSPTGSDADNCLTPEVFWVSLSNGGVPILPL